MRTEPPAGAPRDDDPLPRAVAVLTSLPARELMAQIDRAPGRHLGQLGAELGAPRSRYWRIVQSLEAEGLVRSIRRNKAKLLFPTDLGSTALQFVRKAGMDPRPKARRRVRSFPSLVIYPRPATALQRPMRSPPGAPSPR